MCFRLTFRLLLMLTGLAFVLDVRAQSGTTYCNPLDLNYQYNFEGRRQNISYRSGADPVLILHRGEYFLFSTIAGGFWHSINLRDWQHVKPKNWPEGDMVAPAALSAQGKLFLFPSTYEQRPIYVVAGSGPFELEEFNPLPPLLPGAPGPWDPALFHDEASDRWYMYFGSSNLYPIYGIELDGQKQLTYRGTARALIALQPYRHGWERFGRDHRDTIKPFIEGAWMTKHGGRYYLQYAAPGTEYNVYANGTYVGETPMGPFTYAPNNPVSYKPGGFVTGAGHGNTFEDRHGNFWNTGTPWWAVNFNFERRIAMFPTGFDADGLMHANTRFGDFPQFIPTNKWSNSDSLFTGWMLLSYRKPCVASSTQYPYGAVHVTDENPRTYWLAATNKAGEQMTVDLAYPCELRALQVNFTDHKSGLFESGPNVYTQFRLHHSLDGTAWELLADLSNEKRDRPNAYIELPKAVRARYVRYEHLHVGSPNLAISDLRVFGIRPGATPATPARLQARRDADARNVFLNWDEVPGAVGYNIRWGIAPNKLYQTYQVFADQRTEIEIRALTVGQKYSFAIEAFNESGVSKLSDPVHVD
ncbi:MAG: family 43 glycosylhydrolase [Verrucomicrobiota bacterium]